MQVTKLTFPQGYTEGEWDTYPLSITEDGIKWRELPILVLVAELMSVVYYLDDSGCACGEEHSSGRLTSDVQQYFVQHPDGCDEILPPDIEGAIEKAVSKHEEATYNTSEEE
jgi:hypothetical protein